MDISIVTKDIALQLEQTKGDYIDSWLQTMQKQMNHRFNMKTLRIGNVRAFVAPDLQEIGLFNLVTGLSSCEEEAFSESFEEILHFYHNYSVEKYYIEVNPYHAPSRFLVHLTSQGFSLSRFETYVYGRGINIPSYGSNVVSIREVTSSEVDLFATLHIQGYQEALAHVSKPTLRLYYECLKILYGCPGWHLYIAWVNDIPSGMGMLYMQDGRASLAGGATLPKQRRQGVQTALLRHRIQVAAQAQCTLIVGQASVVSTSQHNMERLGLSTAYTGTIWTRLPSKK